MVAQVHDQIDHDPGPRRGDRDQQGKQHPQHQQQFHATPVRPHTGQSRPLCESVERIMACVLGPKTDRCELTHHVEWRTRVRSATQPLDCPDCAPKS